jgi:hypothetical protein
MRVTHTVQSPGNDPVTYNYTRSGVSAIEAAQAVTTLLSMDYNDVPASHRPKTLAITITF